MRSLAALFVLGIVGISPSALADQPWRARPVLEPGAPANCKEADVTTLFFDLAPGENELSLKTKGGEAFSAPIGGDGSVTTTFKVPVGTRQLSVDLTGNVKTREIEVFNRQYSCRFKLVPVQ